MKKENKNLYLLLPILLIVIVVVISIVIILRHKDEKVMNNEINNSTLENNDVNNNVNDDNSSQNAVHLVQFDTDFYEVKDVALAYQNCKDVNSSYDFEYDLDGDEVKEIITLKRNDQTNGQITYQLLLNGEKFFEFFQAPDSGIVYIVDLDKNDKTKEIITYDDGPSADPTYRIFTKSGSTMKLLSDDIGKWLNQEGIITSKEINNYRAQTQLNVFQYYYKLENNDLKKTNLDISKISNLTFTSENGLFTTNLKNIDKYMETNDLEQAEIYKLTANDKFTIIGFENDIDIKIKLLDGREGYLLGNHFSG